MLLAFGLELGLLTMSDLGPHVSEDEEAGQDEAQPLRQDGEDLPQDEVALAPNVPGLEDEGSEDDSEDWQDAVEGEEEEDGDEEEIMQHLEYGKRVEDRVTFFNLAQFNYL